MGGDTYRVLQVSNISPSATKDQIQTLFSYIGRIEDCKVYPSDTATQSQVKFAYVKFEDERSVEVGQHLTNTVFLDRALVCVPAQTNAIPDEETALQTGGPPMPGQRQLPPNVTNQEQDTGDGTKMISTTDPMLTALGLPQYPLLPGSTEPSKVEEIRRTVYVGNLPKGCDGEELMGFFNACIGEVMYLRMAAGNDYLPCDYAYIEFSNQNSVPLALQNSDNLDFKGNLLRIQHSKVAIIKPQRKTAEQSLEEVEELIKITEGGKISEIGRGYSPSVGRKDRSRSRSSRRRRSRSRSRSRRSRSRSKSRRRSRSRSRRKSRSRDRRSRSKDKERKKKDSKRSKSRDRDKEKKASKSKDKEKKDKEKERDSKKDRKRSRSRSVKKEKEKEKHKKSSSSSKNKPSSSRVEESPKRKKEKKEAPSPASTATTDDSSAAISPKKTPKSLAAQDLDDKQKLEIEEESLRERLLQRVKIKKELKRDGEDSDD